MPRSGQKARSPSNALPADLRPARPKVDTGRYARKRAVVLLLVHVAIAAHIVHWLLNGRTLAPLELNEVVYTLELGIVTAGFLFMCLAFASVLVFGRFFCSWGCHILALQDGAAWLLRKLGFKPRPVRSRLLVFAPFVVLGYMFVWPQVTRLLEGRPHPGFRVAGDAEGWASFVTSDFWRNLPGAGVIIATFFVCGFLVVYVLGTRSFCRYGCPYGAAFALADRLAPVRIVARHSCGDCGACTAACDSRVRVHEEIARYGMVVDPNCLRDLDCVAACPDQGLAVGFARPSLLRRVQSDVKVRHIYDFSVPEEILAGIVCIGTVLALRGLYDLVPFFFSIAVGLVTAAAVIALVRLARRDLVSLARFTLKAQGRLKPAGVVFLAVALAWIALLAHSGWVRWHAWAGLREYALIPPAPHDRPDDGASATREAAALERLSVVNRAGFLPTPTAIRAAADLHGRAAKRAFDRGVPRKAVEHLVEVVRLQPGAAEARCELGAILIELGEIGPAISHLREATRVRPEHADAHHNLAVALAQAGAIDEALASAERAVELSPADATARAFRDHLKTLPRR